MQTQEIGKYELQRRIAKRRPSSATLEHINLLECLLALFNARSTFQRAIDVMLSSVKWKFCLVYLDDIIIYSSTLQQHLMDLDLVLGLLRRAGATLKLKKCHFFKDNVKYLGHVILPGKLQVDQSKTDTIKYAEPRRTRTELMSFLGMCNVYRRFIPQFSKIAAP
jgi:Reverse transcriptase (RNA-dependent DNA polymerase)